MKNYLNFENEIKNIETEIDKLKDPYNNEGISSVDTDKIDKLQSDLDKKLISEGYNLKRIINYKAIAQEKFNNDEIEKLKVQIPDIVYVYSQNSALSFLNMIKNCNLQNSWMNTNLMCISEKTSAILNEIKWKKIFLFNPGEEEFLLYKI